MDTTTSYGNFVTQCPDAGSTATLKDYIASALGGYADDYDVDGLADAFRDALNERLEPSGVSMHGDEFYGPHPVVDVDISAVWQAVDFWALAKDYDRSEG